MKDNYSEANELLVDEGPAEVAKEPKFRRPKKIFQKRKRLVILAVIGVLVLTAALLLLNFIVFAPEEEYDDSAAFYFSSNFLSEEGGEYTVYDSIEFNLYNYADSLRVSKEPLEDFEIKVEAEGKNITGKVEISTGETAMTPEVRSGSTVTIEVPEEYYDKKIKVTATSSPIKKELSADFIIKPEWGYELKDAEGQVCAELVIFANQDVSLMLTWDSEELIADSTDSYIKTAEAGTAECYIELVGDTSISIPMFKVDPTKDYSSDEDVVKIETSKKKPAEKAEPEEDVAVETEEVVA